MLKIREIMNMRYISAQRSEIVEAVLPLQKSSAAPRDSLFSHIHMHAHTHNSAFVDITHKAAVISSLIKLISGAE